MNFKSILILQAAGIGDVLFCQKIAEQLAQKYKKPIEWPIIKEIAWVGDYLVVNPLIQFVEYRDEMYNKYLDCKVPQIVDDVLVVPINNAEQSAYKQPIMKSKYAMCNLDHGGWEKYIKIKRNKEKEDALYNMVVSTKDYVYVNKIYSTPPIQKISNYVNFNPLENQNIVYHKFIDGYNIFDWIKVALNAEEIHTVSTCNFYIFEALQCSMPPIHIYCRDHPSNLEQLAFLKPQLNKNWKYHGDH
jgi:hypothetical protein